MKEVLVVFAPDDIKKNLAEKQQVEEYASKKQKTEGIQ